MSLMDYSHVLLPIIAKPSRRADVVPLYASGILFEAFARPPQAKTRWAVVNQAIADRWSWSAVVWIKKQAWKRAEAQARERSQAQATASRS